jgi:hypothetical protein
LKQVPSKVLAGKENQKGIDDSVLKMISYGNLNRSIEEKAAIIDRQKEEIATLKQCVSDIKHNAVAKEVEGEKAKQEEIARLK